MAAFKKTTSIPAKHLTRVHRDHSLIEPNHTVFHYFRLLITVRYCKRRARHFKPYCMPLTKQDILHIRQAKTILAENFDKHITIPQLARQAGINEAKLKEGFKELFGLSIHTYLQQLRLEKAKHLLLTTEWSVTDITYDIGYSHVTHFITLFKKETGLTPAEWRKEFKG
jgi:AraC-like DNA-binding protein